MRILARRSRTAGSSTERHRNLAEEIKHLEVISPIPGTVTTPRLHDLLGSYLKSGTEVAEVADLSTMTARIYVPEFSMRDVRLGAPVRLHAESQFAAWAGTLSSLAPASSSIEAGLIEKAQLEGIRVPKFYLGKVELQNQGDLREGMSGNAKILIGRRSIAGTCLALCPRPGRPTHVVSLPTRFEPSEQRKGAAAFCGPLFRRVTLTIRPVSLLGSDERRHEPRPRPAGRTAAATAARTRCRTAARTAARTEPRTAAADARALTAGRDAGGLPDA